MATAKKTTKKDLESKIAQLEAKLSQLSTQLETNPAKESKPAQTKPAEVKPAPVVKKEKGSLPKGFGESDQKPAETKPAPVVKKEKGSLPKGFEQPAETKPAKEIESDPGSLEHAYQNASMSDFHQYRAKVTGYTPAPNRYFVRRTAPVGKVATTSWHVQKAVVTGYTQPSNQYFATRARLAYHPPDKTFTGYGISFGAGSAQTQVQTASVEQKKTRGTLPKGF